MHVHTHTHIFYICTEGWRGSVATDQNDVIRFSWHLFYRSLSLSLSITDLHFSLPPHVFYLTVLFVDHHQSVFSFTFPSSFFLLQLLGHYQIRSASSHHWAAIQFCCWVSHPFILSRSFSDCSPPLLHCIQLLTHSPFHCCTLTLPCISGLLKTLMLFGFTLLSCSLFTLLHITFCLSALLFWLFFPSSSSLFISTAALSGDSSSQLCSA